MTFNQSGEERQDCLGPKGKSEKELSWKMKEKETTYRDTKKHARKGNNLVWMEGDMNGGRRNDEAKMVGVTMTMVVMMMIVKGIIMRCNGSSSKY